MKNHGVSRKTDRLTGVLAVVLCAVTVVTAMLLSACSGSGGQAGSADKNKKRFQTEYLTLFDTVTTFIGFAESEEAFGEMAQKFYAEMEEYHKLYDIYNDYSGINNIKTVNDRAGKEAVQVDERIIGLLLKAKEMHQATEGRMNVAFGSVLALWHDYRTKGLEDPQGAELPPMEVLRAADGHTDIEKLEIDEAAKTVFLADGDMRLDVGALAKGYAVQRVAESMKAQGYDNLLISAGGNICAVGTKAAGEPWIVGIQNPDTDSDEPYACRVAVSSGSVVTSGDYQRYYTVDGERYSHIIDKDTLMPAKNFRAVSLICEDSGEADALSTAIFCMSYEEGRRFLEDYGAKRGSKPECMWVFADGEKMYTEGFESKLYEASN